MPEYTWKRLINPKDPTNKIYYAIFEDGKLIDPHDLADTLAAIGPGLDMLEKQAVQLGEKITESLDTMRKLRAVGSVAGIRLTTATRMLDAAAEQAFHSDVVETQSLEMELEQLPGVSRDEFKADWKQDWLDNLIPELTEEMKQ